MKSMDPPRREKFCDAVYAILLETDARTLRQLNEKKYSNFKKIYLSFRNQDEQTRSDLTYAFKLLVKSTKPGLMRLLSDR